MKKLMIIIALGFSSTLIYAQKIQESGVPALVKNTIKKEFPSVKNVKWEKEQGNYEAGFSVNKIDHSLLFDEQGNMVEKEIKIELNQLPKGVIEYVKKNYQGKEPKGAAKITNAKGLVTYEAEIKGMDLLFDSNGKFIKEVID
jgi:hypothetical protein